MSHTNKRLAEVAYNAYCETTGWKSAITGAYLPPFDKVPDKVRDGWVASALAVARVILDERRNRYER
jgi:hypothetical protein